MRGLLTRLLCCALALVSLTGCSGVGAVLGKVQGPQWIEARHTLAPKKTLVLAENYSDPGISAIDADRVARAVTEELVENKAASAVDPELLATLKSQRLDGFRKMSIQQIAAATGAEQVIYIDLQSVAVGQSPGSEVLKGAASARVRVIDPGASEGLQVLFPLDAREGLPLTYESPMRRPSDKHNRDTVRTEAILGMSSKIARLFYRYQADDNSGKVFQD
jgi:hypothetical protein